MSDTALRCAASPTFMSVQSTQVVAWLAHGHHAACMSFRHLAFGRIVIIVLPIVGMLPLLASPTALDATTTSGTGRCPTC